MLARGCGPGKMMPSQVQIEFTSDPRLLGMMRAIVERWCLSAHLPEPVARQVTLAVDEAITNVIRHAYQSQPGQPILAVFSRDARGLTFILEDSGAPVDLSSICKHPPDELRSGGRGTHFIREIMDEMEYQTLPARNRIRLVKYLPAAGREPRKDVP